VSPHEEIPERVRPYFGHDKVALFGDGGMPAAPPAPPGSTGRKQGEVAVRDALSKVGSSEPRPGTHPVARPVRVGFSNRMRATTERALFEASQRRTAARTGGPPPHGSAGLVWSRLFVPVWSAVPWIIKGRIVRAASGVKRYGG
jgi:hypothetical protein